MHPILSRGQRVALYLVGWLVIALLFSSLIWFSQHMRFEEALGLLVPMCLAYALICLAPWYTCNSFPVSKTKTLTLVGVHGAAAVLTGLLWILLGQVMSTIGVNVFEANGMEENYRRVMPVLFVSGVLLFVLSILIHYLVIAFEDARSAERKALELQVLARESELKALRAQINPHFLFNSLNSVSALTTKDPAAARAMTLRLASFFRETVRLGTLSTIPLEQEVALLDDFLSIEKVRFGDRLGVKQSIAAEALQCAIPALLLQPLMENAIRHGVGGMVTGGTITLSVEKDDRGILVRIENPFDPESKTPKGAGVGLSNIKSRLNALYGKNARVDAEQSDGIFRVEISLPDK